MKPFLPGSPSAVWCGQGHPGRRAALCAVRGAGGQLRPRQRLRDAAPALPAAAVYGAGSARRSSQHACRSSQHACRSSQHACGPSKRTCARWRPESPPCAPAPSNCPRQATAARRWHPNPASPAPWASAGPRTALPPGAPVIHQHSSSRSNTPGTTGPHHKYTTSAHRRAHSLTSVPKGPPDTSKKMSVTSGSSPSVRTCPGSPGGRWWA